MLRFRSISLAFLLLTAGLAPSQTWNNYFTSDWGIAANWLPAGVPTSSSTTQLFYNSILDASYTSNNNLGLFELQLLSFNNHSNNALIVNNNSGSSIQFAVNGFIAQNGPGTVTVQGTTLSVPGNLTVSTGISGSGVLNLNSQIVGLGSLTINRLTSNYLGLTSLGSTTLNTYSGGTFLNAGILSLTNAANLGAGTLTVNTTGVGLLSNGELRAGASGQTFNNPITINLGATLNVSTGNTYVIGSAVSGAGGFNVGNYILSNNITLEGANSFSGPTTVQFGTVGLRGTTGALASSSITLFRNSSLTLDSAAATTGTGNTAGNHVSQDRIPDSAIVTFNRSNFNLVANTAASTTETIGTLNNSGWGILNFTPSSGTGVTLTVNDLNRVNRGTFEFRGGNLGLNAPGSANSANVLIGNINGSPAATLLFGGGTPGTPRTSIFPFMTGSNAPATNGDTLLTYHPTNGVRLLNNSSEYASTLPVATYQNATLFENNVRTTIPLFLPDQTAQANALVIAGNGAGVFGFGGLNGQLNPRSGAILNTTTTGMIGTKVLSFQQGVSPGEGFITANGNLNIDAQLTSNSGITIGGVARVALLNSSNAIGGPITLNFGTLQVNDQSQLGSTPVLNFQGGFLNLGNTATGTMDVYSVDLNFGPAGGIIRALPLGGNANSTSVVAMFTGSLTGTGPLQINSTGLRAISGGGTVVLAGNASGYSGLVIVDGGVLEIDSAARLGTNPYFSLGSTSTTVPATLAVTNSTSMTKNVMINGLGFFDISSGAVFTIDGTITGTQTGAGIQKRGPGELVLTSDVTYGGPTTLGDTAVNFLSVGGTLRIKNNGAILNSNTFTIHSGSTLILDNADVLVENRINNAPMNLAGGTLRMIGNLTVPTSEFAGQLTFNSATSSVIEVQPGVGTTAAIFFSGSTNNGLTRSAGSSFTLSAPNLGGVGPGSGQINIVSRLASSFGSGPTLSSGILAYGFGESSGNIGMLTYDSVGASPTLPPHYRTRLLTIGEYTTNSFPDTGSSTANHRQTAAASPTGSPNVNSLFLDTGGSLSIGVGQTVGISTGTIIMAGGTSITGGTISRPGGNDVAIYTGTGTATLGSAINTLGTSNSLIKAGPGTLELTANLGTTNQPAQIHVSRGTLRLGTGGGFAATTVVNVAAGATFDVNGTGSTFSIAGLNGLGTVDLGGTAGTVLQIGGTATTSLFGGSIVGTGSIEKVGTGTLRFTRSFDYSGSITLTGGTLSFGNAAGDSMRYPLVAGGAINASTGTTIVYANVTDFARPINLIGSSGSVTLSNGGGFGTNTRISGAIDIPTGMTLNVGMTTSGFVRISSAISGGGALTFNSIPQAIIDGTNSHTGGTNLITSSGIIGVGSNSAFGTGTLTVGVATTFFAFGADRTVNNLVNLNANVTFGTTLSLYTGHNLTFAGDATMNATRTFNTIGSGRLTFTNLGGAFGITKQGGGTLALQGGSISYTGATDVQGGTLLANGTLATGGNLTVQVGAALGGTGVINRNVTVLSLGRISPGESAGNLTVNGNLTLAGNAVYYWELANLTTTGPGTNWDRITMNSGQLSAAANTILVPSFIGTASSPDSNPFWASTHRWNNIIDLQGTAINIGSSSLVIDNSFWAAFGGFNTEPAISGSGIDLVWLPIPEPSLMALGLLALPLLRRRRVA